MATEKIPDDNLLLELCFYSPMSELIILYKFIGYLLFYTYVKQVLQITIEIISSF